MRSYQYILLLCCLTSIADCFSQGLKFNSAELPIDKRTTYNVLDAVEPDFSESFDISFDMSLYPITEIGYVLRIKLQGSNKTFNLFYDGRGDDFFKFNEEGRSTLIVAPIDRQTLLDTPWFKMKLTFALANDSIGIQIHDRHFGAKCVDLPDKCSPQIIFGKSDYVIDVPSFAIRNVTVNCGKTIYACSLLQSEGETVFDSKGRPVGHVQNPEWLINNAYHWQYNTSFESTQVAGAGYNPKRKEIYFFNRDSLSTYNVRTEIKQTSIFDRRCPVELILGTNFVDADHDRLYAYEVYYDDDSPSGNPTVASLDFDTLEWRIESRQELPNQLHHHAMYFDTDRGEYTIYGGFGNMAYSKYFETYSIADHAWHRQPEFTGESLNSRYFSSMGYLPDNNSLYVFGGMGNESGEQAVGRFYFYDLHRIDLTTRQITKLWEIPWPYTNSVPVRGMVVVDDKSFYTLCYPESVSDSYLKLYKFSINDGSYVILGDSIPIHSDKIATNANIYYDAQMDQLYATVQEFDDDIKSTMKLYTLSFPPLTARGLAEIIAPTRVSPRIIIAICGVVLLVVGGIGFGIRRRRKKAVDEMSKRRNFTEFQTPVLPNSIMLFGEMSVHDRRKKDITYSFTTSQRQLFCLILQYTIDGGISSQRLSNLMWPDKPEQKAKNSRGVAINHLRQTLSQLDGVQLVFDKSCFRIESQAPFYCDYLRCMEILSNGDIEADRNELVGILARGKFLKSSNIPLFDDFKNNVECKLYPLLQIELEKSFSAGKYQTAINFAEAIFNIDPLNEDALTAILRSLHKLHRDEDAAIKYKAFALEYRITFNTDYPRTLKSII